MNEDKLTTIEPEPDSIILEAGENLVWITVTKYYMFWKYGEAGMDAMHLYLHLIYTAQLQYTNSIKANNQYLKRGLFWGKDRLVKAKSLLYDLDLIQQVERKNNKGQFAGTYLVVKAKTCPFEFKNIDIKELSGGLETGDPETAGRIGETNALTKNKMLKQLNKYIAPTLKEIQEYIKLKGYNVDATKFYEYYSSNDWKDKNNKQVKNWKLKLLVWRDNAVSSTPIKKKFVDQYENM